MFSLVVGGICRAVRELLKEYVKGTGVLKLTMNFIRHVLTYLRDHHVAVKRAFTPRCFGSLDMRPDFGDNRGAEGDIGHKVTVHDVHMEPVCAILYRVGASGA